MHGRVRYTKVCLPKHTKAAWTPGVLAMLGQKTDVWIAKKLGISDEAVLAKRRRSDIPAARVRGPRPTTWEPAILADLGKMPDSAVVKKHRGKISMSSAWHVRKTRGIAACGHARHKWTKTELRILGTDTDEKVGKNIGISGLLVFKQRRKLGIAAFKSGDSDQEPNGMPRKRRCLAGCQMRRWPSRPDGHWWQFTTTGCARG